MRWFFVVFVSQLYSRFSQAYIGRLHCHQSQTLKKVPALRSISLIKKEIESSQVKHSGAGLMATCVLVGVLNGGIVQSMHFHQPPP
jgi:hypothetical protein